MKIKEYLFPVLEHNKKYYKMFLRFVITNNAYQDFNNGLALRPNHWKYTLNAYNEKNILDCAFPWGLRKGISWCSLSEDWRNKIEFEKK